MVPKSDKKRRLSEILWFYSSFFSSVMRFASGLDQLALDVSSRPRGPFVLSRPKAVSKDFPRRQHSRMLLLQACDTIVARPARDERKWDAIDANHAPLIRGRAEAAWKHATHLSCRHPQGLPRVRPNGIADGICLVRASRGSMPVDLPARNRLTHRGARSWSMQGPRAPPWISLRHACFNHSALPDRGDC